jgi:hypothetical protein
VEGKQGCSLCGRGAQGYFDQLNLKDMPAIRCSPPHNRANEQNNFPGATRNPIIVEVKKGGKVAASWISTNGCSGGTCELDENIGVRRKLSAGLFRCRFTSAVARKPRLSKPATVAKGAIFSHGSFRRPPASECPVAVPVAI